MRVLVANQPRILRECIAAAIAMQGEVEVVLEAANAAAILRSVQQHKPAMRHAVPDELASNSEVHTCLWDTSAPLYNPFPIFSHCGIQ